MGRSAADFAAPVGCFAGIHVSGEMTAGELAVALGTLLLALFTWRLARQTKAGVRETTKGLALTKSELELTQRSIENQDMPFVIASGYKETGAITLDKGEETWVALRLGLWNVGRGPGIVNYVQLAKGDDELLVELPADIPISVGDRGDHVIAVRDEMLDRLDGDPVEGLDLRVMYQHASGNLYATTSRARVEGETVIQEQIQRKAAAQEP